MIHFDNFKSLYEKFLGTCYTHDNTETMKAKKNTARTEENFQKLTELMTSNPSTPHTTTARRVGVF